MELKINDVVVNVEAGCSDCGEDLEVTDIEISEADGSVMISVSPCNRCIGDAFSEGQQRGKLDAQGSPY